MKRKTQEVMPSLMRVGLMSAVQVVLMLVEQAATVQAKMLLDSPRSPLHHQTTK